MTRFPEQHFSVAVLCNFANTDPHALADQVADIVLAKDSKLLRPSPREETATAPTPLTADQMTTIAGIYWNRDGDDFANVQVKDGKLKIDVGQDDFKDLKQFAPGHFHVADVPWGEHVDVQFPVAADKPRRMETLQDGGKPELYEAVAA